MKAVLLISHGSKAPQTTQEIKELEKRLKERLEAPLLKAAFLEINEPDIPTGLETLIKEGATEIVVLLNFLNTGKHAGIQIPRMIDEAKGRYPEVQIKMTPCIGSHKKMLELYAEMVEEAS